MKEKVSVLHAYLHINAQTWQDDFHGQKSHWLHNQLLTTPHGQHQNEWEIAFSKDFLCILVLCVVQEEGGNLPHFILSCEMLVCEMHVFLSDVFYNDVHIYAISRVSSGFWRIENECILGDGDAFVAWIGLWQAMQMSFLACEVQILWWDMCICICYE